MGTGTIIIPVGGVDKSGIVYLGVKGTWKWDPLMEKLIFNGKIAAGGKDFICSRSFRSTF
jgi:hypothetical protein